MNTQARALRAPGGRADRSRADATGIAAFCDRQYPQLVGTLTVYCGDRHVAEELAQDALAKAVRQWPRVSQMASPGGWLHRVAINLANSRFRRQLAERRAVQRLAAAGATTFEVDSAEVVAVRQAVAALPPRMRTVLVLRYFADYSVDQVAEVTGLSPGSVRVVTSRAIKQLRERSGLDLTGGEENHDVA